jgi:hypothetical protein
MIKCLSDPSSGSVGPDMFTLFFLTRFLENPAGEGRSCQWRVSPSYWAFAIFLNSGFRLVSFDLFWV